MYTRLISLLEECGAHYRVIDHAPEGRTEIVSPLRGNDLRDAAKCLILIVKTSGKSKKYVLAVVPGDRKLSWAMVKGLYRATYVGFASSDVAEDLAGSITGTILPFSFTPKLELIVDCNIATTDEIYFNAGCLDRSIALWTADYLRIAKPRIESIVEPRS